MTRLNIKTVPTLGGRIRRRRKQLAMTLQALCDKADLSPGYLSQVERGLATPSLGTLAQIADGLDVGVDHFVGEARPSDLLSRADTRARFSIEGSGMVYESLASPFPGAELSSYILHVPPGFASETVAHEGEEIVYVLDGEITQTLGGERFVLRAGDTLHYCGTTPHSWLNESAAPARILWTGTLSVLQGRRAKQLPEIIPANINT